MKKLRKLVCILLAVCVTFIQASVLFADTGTAYEEASADSSMAAESISTENSSVVSEESADDVQNGDSADLPGTQEGTSGITGSGDAGESDPGSDSEEPASDEPTGLADPGENTDSGSTPDEGQNIGPESGPTTEGSEDEYRDDSDTIGSDSENSENESEEQNAGGNSEEEPADAGSEEETAWNEEQDIVPEQEDSEENIVSAEEEEQYDLTESKPAESQDPEDDPDDSKPLLKAKAKEKSTGELKSGTSETYTVKFNANGGSGSMPALKGLSADTGEKIPVNAYTNSGEKGNYVRSWNTKRDGSGKSYAPNSALSAVIRDLIADEKNTVTLYAQWTKSVTLNVRIIETHPSETVFGTQTGSILYSRYNGGNYLQQSSDGGTTWSRVITKVSTDEEFCKLPRVSAASGMCLSRTGYTNTNAAAYNTAKDGSGLFLRANQTSADQSNPVNTTTLNGGIPLTEAGHTVNIYVYWKPNTYKLKVHSNAASIGRPDQESTVEYSGLQVGTKYYLNNGAYSPEAYPSYNWLSPSPGFYVEGYLFYGWNTKADGSGKWISGMAPSFSNLSDDNGGYADLYAVWREPEGLNQNLTALENGAVITKGYNNFSDVNLMIPKYYTGEGKQTDPGNIEFGVTGGNGRVYWNQVFSSGQSGSGAGDEGEAEEDNESSASLLYLTIDLDQGTKQIYDLKDVSAYVTLRNRAFDMNGNVYDVRITVSGITAADYSGKYDTGNLFVVRSSGSCNLYSEMSLSSTYDVRIEILNPVTAKKDPGFPVKDKTTVLYFADMDIPVDVTAREFLGQPTENGNTYGYYDVSSGEVFSGAEHIEVRPESSSRIFVSNDNMMHAFVKNGWTQLVGTYYTGLQSKRAGLVDAERNGVNLPTEATSTAVVFNTGNIQFRFGATRASTALFMDDIFVNVTSNVRDSEDYNIILENGTGGFIDHGGEGPVSFARGSGPAYSIKAQDGYSIKDLWVDGVKLIENGSVLESSALTAEYSGTRAVEAEYLFENLQTDHTIDVSFKQDLHPADLILHKVCSNGSQPSERSVFQNAEFGIQYYAGIYTTASAAAESESPGKSWTFKTDENGELRIGDPANKVSGDDLFLDRDGRVSLAEGTYVIQETRAPDGFALNNRRYVFTVKFDNSGKACIEELDANGYTQKVAEFTMDETIDPDITVFEELLFTNSITVSKTVFREDYREEHGIPGFVFEISGRDLTGEDRTYFTMISFDDLTAGNGAVTKNAVLTGLPSGTYSVRELDSMRYALTNIESDVFTVTKEAVGEEIEGIQEVRGFASGKLTGDMNACAGFTDRKIRWDEFSDTSSAVNPIEIENRVLQ